MREICLNDTKTHVIRRDLLTLNVKIQVSDSCTPEPETWKVNKNCRKLSQKIRHLVRPPQHSCWKALYNNTEEHHGMV